MYFLERDRHRVSLHKEALGRGFQLLLLALFVVFISSCQALVKEEPPPCPKVSLLEETASITKLASITKKSEEGANIATTKSLNARIKTYQGSCSYDSEKKIMSVSLILAVEAERTIRFVGDEAYLDYYIAIPAFFPDPKAKKIIPLSIKFVADEMKKTISLPEQHITIPVPIIKDLKKYEIFVGWQLNGDELTYNRSQLNLQ